MLGKEYKQVIDLPSGITELVRSAEPYLYTALDIVNEDGEVVIPFNLALTQEVVEKARLKKTSQSLRFCLSTVSFRMILCERLSVQKVQNLRCYERRRRRRSRSVILGTKRSFTVTEDWPYWGNFFKRCAHRPSQY